MSESPLIQPMGTRPEPGIHRWRGGGPWKRNRGGEFQIQTLPVNEPLFPVVFSYLRTMTALLDPAQLEERERRRMKQLEQQVRGRRETLLNSNSFQPFHVALFLSEPSRPRSRKNGDKGSVKRR